MKKHHVDWFLPLYPPFYKSIISLEFLLFFFLEGIIKSSGGSFAINLLLKFCNLLFLFNLEEVISLNGLNFLRTKKRRFPLFNPRSPHPFKVEAKYDFKREIDQVFQYMVLGFKCFVFTVTGAFNKITVFNVQRWPSRK